MDDLFDFDLTPKKPVEMGAGEYFTKSTSLLYSLLNEYSQCWQDRPLEESEYPDEAICDQCKGCGVFGEEETECFQDRQEGQCYKRIFDTELFADEFTMHLHRINELIAVDKIK